MASSSLCKCVKFVLGFFFWHQNKFLYLFERQRQIPHLPVDFQDVKLEVNNAIPMGVAGTHLLTTLSPLCRVRIIRRKLESGAEAGNRTQAL